MEKHNKKRDIERRIGEKQIEKGGLEKKFNL